MATRVPAALARLPRQFRKLVRVLRVPAYWRGLRYGSAASIEHRDVPFGLDFVTVIDVGANRGQFALFALHRFPRAVVHAFEPLPPAVAVFRRVTEPSARVALSAVALGAAPGRLTMHVTNEDDSSSALPLTPEASARLGLREVARVEVPVTTLDLAFPAPPSRPCLLKLDVQGGELEVLRGAERLLASVDEVLTEVSFVPQYVGQPLADDVIAFLAERGFVAVARGERRDAAQADVLLRRREG